MKRNPEILNELKEVAPALANAPVGMPFEVPEGYFETPVLKAIKAMLNTQGTEHEAFDLPDAYFETFPPRILSEISRMERFGSRNTPFSHPEGYFESFPDKILGRVQKEEAPVRRLIVRDYSWLRIAASILLVFGFFSVWKYLPQDSPGSGSETAAEKSSSTWLPDAVLLSEIQLAEAGTMQVEHAGTEENSTVTEFLMDESAEMPSLEGYSIEAIHNDLDKIAFTNGG